MMDFHCHLDLYKNPLEVFEEVKRRNTFVLAVTTSPRAYVKTAEYFRTANNVFVAVGLHPELIAERSNEKELLFDCMKKCEILGEIGIDGSPRSRASLALQREIFEDILKKADKTGGKIMSIHSRGAVKDVLELMYKYKGTSIPILHWFTGTPKEAEQALEMGCWFSINPNMCNTKSGKEVISRVPIEKMFSETDAPFTQKGSKPYMPWDDTVVRYIADSHGISKEDVNARFEENMYRIFSEKGIRVNARQERK